MPLRSKKVFLFLIFALMTAGALGAHFQPSLLAQARVRFLGARTVDQVIATLEPKLQKKVSRMFAKVGCSFPDSRLTYIGLKKERFLEVWCNRTNGGWGLAHKYRILAASGRPGPKLKEGDLQVPEGIYTIPVLNPNSRFHLSMKLNYPNKFDREKGAIDGRRKLGGDIFIHGSFFSIGCIAIGDKPIEELFYITRKTGRPKVTVIIMPYDFRIKPPIPPSGTPAWTIQLYREIEKTAKSYK